ncbi:MAG: DUF2690 domain-containing protein [Kineosporiaceae bacterium]
MSLSLRARRGAAVALLAAAQIAVLGVASADAAACRSYSCNGLDPQATTNSAGQPCSADAVTRQSFLDGRGYLIELRYSSSCNAMWARAKVPYAKPGETWYPTAWLQLQRYDYADYSTGKIDEVQIWFGSTWTKMNVNVGWFRACLVNSPDARPNRTTQCTARA